MAALDRSPKKSRAKHNMKNRFELLQSLGEGTYGKVKLAVDRKTGEKIAIKYIMKKKISSEQDLQRVRREIEIMSSLTHQHIVQIYEVYENKDKFVIMMEYVNGGELYEYVNVRGMLSDAEARRIFRQVVSAVHYLHEGGIVHRDLKLENILLDVGGEVKLADFGLSNLWQHNRFLHTFCGSPLYASPEIVNGRPYYGPEVDCWSLGVLLYTLVYGTMPFDGSNFDRLRKQITQGSYYEPSKPSDAASLIRRLLTVNPAKRATVADVCRHWWTNVDCARSLWHEVQEVKGSQGSQSSLAEKRTSDYFDDDDDSIFVESTAQQPGGPASGKLPCTENGATAATMRTLTSVDFKKGALLTKKDAEPVSNPTCSRGDSGCALADRHSVTSDNTSEVAGQDRRRHSPAYCVADIDAVLDALDGRDNDERADHELLAGTDRVSVSKRRSISVLQTHGDCSTDLTARDRATGSSDRGRSASLKGALLVRDSRRGEGSGCSSLSSSSNVLDFSSDSAAEESGPDGFPGAITDGRCGQAFASGPRECRGEVPLVGRPSAPAASGSRVCSAGRSCVDAGDQLCEQLGAAVML